jgi:hypothetical protein
MDPGQVPSLDAQDSSCRMQSCIPCRMKRDSNAIQEPIVMSESFAYDR